MNTGKLLLATVLAAAVFFFLGWLWYGMLMTDFYNANAGSATGVPREMPEFMYLILGELVMAFVMAYNFPKWSRGNYSMSQGFQYGAWFGLFAGLGLTLIAYSTTNIWTLKAVLSEAIYGIISAGIAGIVIALIWASGKKEAG